MPADDIVQLQRENLWYQALPVLLYLVAYAFMFLYGYIVQAYVAVIAWIFSPLVTRLQHFGRVFLPRDASTERGYEIACRLSVHLSVCLSVCL